MHQVRLVHGNVFIDELEFVSTVPLFGGSAFSVDGLTCFGRMFQTSAPPLATV